MEESGVNLANNWLYYSFYIIYIITILSTVVVVISENRNPVKTIAWVVVLLFLPVIGIIFYFFFGQDFTKYRMISRKSLKKLIQQSEYADPTDQEKELPTRALQLIRLNYTTNSAPFYAHNAITIFTNGKEKFDRLKIELSAAQKYIHIQYYIFENDKLGNEICDILIEKAQAGVEVRLIYDDVGCWRVDNAFFERLSQAGVIVRPFMKVTFPRLANKINYRNHRKIVVIDGKTGFMGGMNIADRYVEGLPWGIWRDTHIMIKGPGVHGLQSSFSVDWYFTERQLLYQEQYYPTVDPCGKVGLQIVTAGPIGTWKEIALGIFRAIANAQKYIYIQTPYFLPTEGLTTALQMAALSKVDVRIMLPAQSDSAILYRGTCSYITPMLKAGVKIYFYEPGFLHAKTVVIDDYFSTIGSTNLDFRSFEHNFEVNAFMYNEELAIEIKNIFLSDQKQCRRITLRTWKRRPWRQKVIESVVRLLSPLL